MKDRIIFLDIDGVLVTQHGTDYWLGARGDIFDDDGYERFAPDAVEGLNKIIRSTEAKVVISSAWRRRLDLKEIKDVFSRNGVECEIIDGIPINEEKDRGEKIHQWIKKNGRPLSFIILDDDVELDIVEYFPKERCITPNYISGIAEKSSYKRCINYLKRDLKKVKNSDKNLF